MKQQNKAVKEPIPMTEPKYCPYCGGRSVSYPDGTSVCVSCGASFIAARVYPKPELIRDFDRSTVEDSFGKRFALFSRMPSSSDLSQIDRALSSLGVPNEVREEAYAIYGRAYAMEAAGGIRSGEGLAAASVYAACKQTGLPKSLDEIAAVFDVDKMEVERAYTCLVNEMGYLPTHLMAGKITTVLSDQPIRRIDAEHAHARLHVPSADVQGSDVSKFMEKKGTYEFLRLLKEKPRRWKTLEKELALSPRTLSERISQALDLGFIEKVRRLKIGATYYRLTKKGNDVFETMIRSTKIY